MSNRYDATSLRLYRGADLAATDSTISAPWGAVSSFFVGSQFAPADHWFGFVGLIYVPGGLTDAERSALARLTTGILTYVG